MFDYQWTLMERAYLEEDYNEEDELFQDEFEDERELEWIFGENYDEDVRD